MSAQFTAFLDANVLYQAPLRDLLLELSVSDLFQARWSNDVLDEVRRIFKNRRPDIPTQQVDAMLNLMNKNVRDCLVEFPASLIGAIKGLNDENDRHVVAAAIQARAHAIITWNLKDFPSSVLDPYRLEAIDPDSFLIAQYDLDQGRFMECVLTVRNRLKNPVIDAEEYLAIMIKGQLVGTAARLKPMLKFI